MMIFLNLLRISNDSVKILVYITLCSVIYTLLTYLTFSYYFITCFSHMFSNTLRPSKKTQQKFIVIDLYTIVDKYFEVELKSTLSNEILNGLNHNGGLYTQFTFNINGISFFEFEYNNRTYVLNEERWIRTIKDVMPNIAEHYVVSRTPVMSAEAFILYNISIVQ